MTNDLKLKIYPAVIAILGLGLVALLLSRVEFQVTNQSPLDRSLDAPPSTLDQPASRALDLPEIPVPSPSPTPSSALPVTPPSTLPAPVPASGAPASAEGGLRVSNQTSYPVRVALLHQQERQEKNQPEFTQPVHWDFAPEEGKAKGLILSLPSGGLRLSSGDVLVAFAQDGSRRYWGPYVIGETELPTWSSEQQEWILPLQP